jgi:hypothetical protein
LRKSAHLAERERSRRKAEPQLIETMENQMKIRLDKWLKGEFDPPPAICTTQGRGTIPCWVRR